MRRLEKCWSGNRNTMVKYSKAKVGHIVADLAFVGSVFIILRDIISCQFSIGCLMIFDEQAIKSPRILISKLRRTTAGGCVEGSPLPPLGSHTLHGSPADHLQANLCVGQNEGLLSA